MTTPIIFASPGESPDTCLTVFDQEFHTDSTILRLHSGFFRTFLTNKTATNNTNFKYEYVSKVDEDGSWGLQPKSTVNTENSITATSDPRDAIRGFHNLLRAIYSTRYRDGHFERFDDVVVLVNLADFYRALPVVSIMVEASLFPDGHIVGGMIHHYIAILNLAYQLRAPKLFKEAFILTVGEAYQHLNLVLPQVDGEIHSVLHKYVARLAVTVASAAHKLHELVGDAAGSQYFDPNQMIGPAIKAACGFMEHSWGRAGGPRWYRALLEASYKPTEAQCADSRTTNHYSRVLAPTAAEEQVKKTINGIVGPLMKNNLCYQTGQYVVGNDIELFVFTKFDDEDLPWNPEEMVW